MSQGKAKVDLQSNWVAETREAAISAFNRCVFPYRAKYPKATEKLVQDRGGLPAFYGFQAEPRGTPADQRSDRVDLCHGASWHNADQ